MPLVQTEYSPGTNSSYPPGSSGHGRGHRVACSSSQCLQVLPSSLGLGTFPPDLHGEKEPLVQPAWLRG